MLPNIDSEKRKSALGVDQILVLSLLDAEGLGYRVEGKPAPA